MKKILTILISCLCISQLALAAQSYSGAGSSFIAPVMMKWAKSYHDETKNQINYQAIGSGGGIRQIEQDNDGERIIGFGATDEPLKTQDLSKHKLLQFPMIVGGIVPIVNIEGVKSDKLVLSGEILADIFMGKITKWNDPKILALGNNKKLDLPNKDIIVVHRADGSGTTFNFTNYLSKVSPAWQKQIGFNSVVKWPGNVSIGAKGNAGVASQVSHIPNAIGYVEFAYAKQSKLTTTLMQNHDGKIVRANRFSFYAAAKNANWSSDNNFYMILTNQPGAKSWPIVATTFILFPKDGKTDTQKDLLDFFTWSYKHGQQTAIKLDYVPIPKPVYEQIFAYWKQALKIK